MVNSAALAQTLNGPRDLEGYWSNTTITPLERPKEVADKAFFTEQEALDWERKTVERRKHPAGGIQIDGTPEWSDMGKIVPSRRTSLIIDPVDGRLPLTEEGRERMEVATRPTESYSSAKDRPISERCLIWREGPPMIPFAGVTGFIQIVQSSGYVLIFSEMIHSARIIPLDGSPHVPENLRLWTGDPRGHWEADTLVVDTTNFNEQVKFLGSTQALHVVERFTRVDSKTINYRFTVDDPATWSRPWTAELALTNIAGPLFEYACHEGNYSLPLILNGARAAEKTEAAKKP
jgi:hypothetical protein